jgi:hypothetical protein
MTMLACVQQWGIQWSPKLWPHVAAQARKSECSPQLQDGLFLPPCLCLACRTAVRTVAGAVAAAGLAPPLLESAAAT